MTGKNLYSQLPLNINLRDDATFENFYTGQNSILISALKSYPQVYLWGKSGVGKTHLLEATCHLGHQQKNSAAYLPLKKHPTFSPEILEGLEFQSIVCLDDLNQVIGIPIWEEALFHFYNRAFAQKTRLILSADLPPQQLDALLPDLKSRLTAGLIFQIKPLSDEEKCCAIQERARYRGLELSKEIASYLLTRHSRNMSELLALLELLDQTTLAAQRKLTIPLIRSVLHKA